MRAGFYKKMWVNSFISSQSNFQKSRNIDSVNFDWLFIIIRMDMHDGVIDQKLIENPVQIMKEYPFEDSIKGMKFDYNESESI